MAKMKDIDIQAQACADQLGALIVTALRTVGFLKPPPDDSLLLEIDHTASQLVSKIIRGSHDDYNGLDWIGEALCRRQECADLIDKVGDLQDDNDQLKTALDITESQQDDLREYYAKQVEKAQRDSMEFIERDNPDGSVTRSLVPSDTGVHSHAAKWPRVPKLKKPEQDSTVETSPPEHGYVLLFINGSIPQWQRVASLDMLDTNKTPVDDIATGEVKLYELGRRLTPQTNTTWHTHEEE